MSDEVKCPVCRKPQPVEVNAAVTLTKHIEGVHRITGTAMMRAVVAALQR